MKNIQPVEFAYLALLDEVVTHGRHRPGTRTGVDTIGLWDRSLVADMRDGFPLLTTKAIPSRSFIAEQCGFLAGVTNAEGFRNLGTRIWDQNANETPAWLGNPFRLGPDDLGRIYSAQWRDWRTPEGFGVDQIDALLTGLVKDPYGRRHIVSAWNPGELDRTALPPCHMMFQCYVEEDEGQQILHLKMTQRSADLFLGVPFNLASYALLLHIFAASTGMVAGRLKIDMGDVHVYDNHRKQVDEQRRRLPNTAPELQILPGVIDDIREHVAEHGSVHGQLRGLIPTMFQITGYHSHPALPAPMAV